MFYPYIEEGGLIWMLPIVAISYFAVALIMERICYWVIYFWNSRDRKHILSRLFQIPMDLRQAFLTTQNSNDPVIQSLNEFLKSYRDFPLHIAERKAIQFAEDRLTESRRFVDWLALFANLSGTLGLAGTVVGISISFKSMSLQDAKSLSLSLATALYTTVGGIILFLPSYLCVFAAQKASDGLENILDTNIQNLKDILESQEKSKIIFDKSVMFDRPQTSNKSLLFDETVANKNIIDSEINKKKNQELIEQEISKQSSNLEKNSQEKSDVSTPVLFEESSTTNNKLTSSTNFDNDPTPLPPVFSSTLMGSLPVCEFSEQHSDASKFSVEAELEEKSKHLCIADEKEKTPDQPMYQTGGISLQTKIQQVEMLLGTESRSTKILDVPPSKT